jgi:CHASE2 domain-containing sensor protein
VSAFAISALVCILTYGLRCADFAPLRELIAFEDRAYRVLSPPSAVQLPPNFASIVFVDIDDNTLNNLHLPAFSTSCPGSTSDRPSGSEASPNPAAGTPRGIIAAIVKVMRAAHARVVFLDYDFRNSLSNDAPLDWELRCETSAKLGSTMILVPHFFTTGLTPTCGNQADVLSVVNRRQLDTVFDAHLNQDLVKPVHPVVEGHELVEGICLAYPMLDKRSDRLVMLPAAMARAVSFVRGDSTPIDAQKMSMLRRWLIRRDTAVLPADQTDRLGYLRISANVLLRNVMQEDGNIEFGALDMSRLQNIIAIVGSTHAGAGDIYRTPVGNLPGALVHANIGLELQMPEVQDRPLWVQFVLDIAVLAIFAVLWIPCGYWIYRWISSNEEMPIVGRMLQCAMEMFVMFALATFFFVITAQAPIVSGWRFAFLSFVLGTIVVFLIEIFSWFSELVGKKAEGAAARRFERGWSGKAATFSVAVEITRVAMSSAPAEQSQQNE